MIGIEIESRGAAAALKALGKDFERNEKRALSEAGRIVQSEAKVLSPIGPTMSQAEQDGYSFDRAKAPGNLQNAIKMQMGRGWVDVGVFHGTAMQYARKIHDKIGWRRRGPGTRAKGTRAGAFFLTRALKHKEAEIQRLFERWLGKAIARFNR